MKALHRFFFLVSIVNGFMTANATIVVNSLRDVEVPAAGEVTLRSALSMAASGETISFHPSLNGQTIELSRVGHEHTPLVGELMGMEDTPSGPISYLIGYQERDYGRSALYAKKDVVIDASVLPDGITIQWTGGDVHPARVMAVYGDLTMRNVSISGGRCVSVALSSDPQEEYPQHSTRARGGGLAVWGIATLEKCRLYDNACFQPWDMEVRDSREGGVFGGGIYADVVQIHDCMISGNALGGAGVSGGGVFTVGGRSTDELESIIERTAVTGNTIAGIFAYGGGVYSDGGGIGKLKTLTLLNCTVATNEVGMYGPGFLYGMGYWRGGGVYMSNGYMELRSCTIVDNAVTGVARTDDLDKPNLAGGVAATIGNAHAVEHMKIGHCIIAGNRVHPVGGTSYNEDIFTGSLTFFISEGYNCVGSINFDQMLVPIGFFHDSLGTHVPFGNFPFHMLPSLCRKHYPKQGDQYGVKLDDVIDCINGPIRCADIVSLGVDAPQNAVMRYAPTNSAVNQIPVGTYEVGRTFSYCLLQGKGVDNLTEVLLDRIEEKFELTGFASEFTANFEAFLAAVDLDGDDSNGLQPYTNPDGDPILTLEDALLYGPMVTWPSVLDNYPYIEFWHQLDAALKDANIPGMSPALLDDDVWWLLFFSGDVANPFTTGNLSFRFWPLSSETQMTSLDQNQTTRPENGLGDIGAIEYVPLSTWGKYATFPTSTGKGADTSDWLGLLEVTHAPWTWCERISCWLNIPEESAGIGQGWIYPPDPHPLQVIQIDGTNWGYSFTLGRWLYLTSSGWVYVV